jgi:hypothetical protein
MLILTIVFWIVFYILFGMSHGFVAKQLEFLKPKLPNVEVMSITYKALWHRFFELFRVFVHLFQLGVMLWYLPINTAISLFLIGATIGILIFDSAINIARARGINWHYLGTCEGKWDGDCLWLKIDKVIPHLIVKFILVAASVGYYFYFA